MPAGLSQRIQSNLVRSSPITLLTPSSVRASLSLVWDAGSSHKFSRRLSRMRACESFATPCTTLMRSNTTRRSAPKTRSRLRRPTSKSMTTTFSPSCARAAPSAAEKVVVIDFDVGLRNLDLVLGAERRVVFELINVVQGVGKTLASSDSRQAGGEFVAASGIPDPGQGCPDGRGCRQHYRRPPHQI